MARFSQLALAAAQGGVRRSRSSTSATDDPYRVGVLFGNGMGGYPDTDQAVKDIIAEGRRRIDPFYMVKMLPNMAAAQVAMQLRPARATTPRSRPPAPPPATPWARRSR